MHARVKVAFPFYYKTKTKKIKIKNKERRGEEKGKQIFHAFCFGWDFLCFPSVVSL